MAREMTGINGHITGSVLIWHTACFLLPYDSCSLALSIEHTSIVILHSEICS